MSRILLEGPVSGLTGSPEEPGNSGTPRYLVGSTLASGDWLVVGPVLYETVSQTNFPAIREKFSEFGVTFVTGGPQSAQSIGQTGPLSIRSTVEEQGILVCRTRKCASTNREATEQGRKRWGGRPRRHPCAKVAVSKSQRRRRPWERLASSDWIWRRTRFRRMAASDGTVVFRRKLARSQVLKFFASRPVCHGGHGGSCRRAPLGACDRDLGTSGQANCARLCEAIREAAEERHG